MRKKLSLWVPLLLAVTIAGCATQYAPERIDNPYGFFMGIWHGMIFPFSVMGKLISWVASLFGATILDDLTVFGRPNTGFWYYVGFVFGLGTLGGGGSQTR